MTSVRILARLLALLVVTAALAGCTDIGSADVDEASASAPTVHEFDIYVTQTHVYEPHEGKRILGFAFALSPEGPFTIPGPELRIREGDTLRVRFHSSGDPHTIHWHGIKLPWEMDGVPFMTQAVAPGESTYVYEFEARESGTYWYHCHVDAPGHVDAGLFGPLIIEPRDATVDLPFSREYTLMLHEVDSNRLPGMAAQRDATNVPRNPFDAAEVAGGMARTVYDTATAFILPPSVGEALGAQGPRDYYPHPSPRYRPIYDTFMINGKSYPETEPVFIKGDETIRIRLVNAGQLVHTMHLHGTHFLVTHKDGYKLPAAYRADTLLIGPGERYDIYVEGDNPGIWDFHDHGGGWSMGAHAANDHAFPGGMNTMLVYEDFVYAKLPEPSPGHPWTSGDYVPWAPSYKGLRIPAGAIRETPGSAIGSVGHGVHGGHSGGGSHRVHSSGFGAATGTGVSIGTFT